MTAITDFEGTITTDGAGTLESLDGTDLDEFDLSSGKFLRLTLLIDDVSDIGNLNFFVGITDVLTNSIKWRFDAETASSKIGKSGEVFVVTLQLAEINAVAGSITLSDRGVPSTTSGFTEVRLQASDDTTGAINVTLLKTEVVTPSLAGGYVSITFDDGYDSTIELAYPRMKSLGFLGTVYPSFDEVGETNHATLVELRGLAGWEVGGHHSTAFTAVDADAARTTLADVKAWLDENFQPNRGYPRGHSLAYPLGRYEDTTDAVSIETLAVEAGFGNGRTILAEVGVSTHAQINALPPALPYRLYGMSSISDQAASGSPARTDRLIGVGGVLDKVAENGGWLILVFHEVVTGSAASALECTEEDFNSIMQAIAARDLTVLPVHRVLELAGV
jgi:peptidoglycan/xylan/chitin deacetylase (PgdA/CDA1 family)